METNQIDIAIRISAAATLLVLAWLQLRDWQTANLPARLFAPLATCLSATIIKNSAGQELVASLVFTQVLDVLSGFTVIFLWWFCLSCFDRQFRIRGFAFAVGLLWASLALVVRWLPDESSINTILNKIQLGFGFCIVGHLIWRLIAEKSGDFIQRRYEARVIVSVVLGGMLLIDLAVDALFGFNWRPLTFSMGQNAIILFFAIWLSGRLLTVRNDVLTFGVTQAKRPALEPKAFAFGPNPLMHRLNCIMNDDRVFLDPNLGFAAFVCLMGAPEKTVRSLINHDLGHDHFRNFLNYYRVNEAKRILEDPSRSNDKVISIGLDSGFASLASFNRVFSSSVGCSPSAYRRRNTDTHAISGTQLGSARPSVF